MRAAGGSNGWPMAAYSVKLCPAPRPTSTPPAAQLVERRHLLGQRHRVVQVVVEHQGAETDPLRGDRRRGEADEGGRLGPDVVADLEDVEAGVLRGTRAAADDVRGAVDVDWKPKRKGRTGRRYRGGRAVTVGQRGLPPSAAGHRG